MQLNGFFKPPTLSNSNEQTRTAPFMRLSLAGHYLHLAVLLGSLSLSSRTSAAQPFENGVIATVHPLATRAGIEAFKEGGNAIDAAVAAGLALGVVDTHNSGLGGGCFMLIRKASGEVLALDGRETAPANARPDMFLRGGHAVPELSRSGALASAVPGEIAAFYEAVESHGKLTWNRHCLAAAALAENGFTVTSNYERRLASVKTEILKFNASREIFTDGSGATWRAGDNLRQLDLAHTLRALGEGGKNWFYKGPFAKRTAEWMKENGGLITEDDFAKYTAEKRSHLETQYRGYTIIGFPPPSSGGVHIGQILNILEFFDLKSLGQGSADFIHVVAESMKLAFADRAFWLGDPDFTKVPRGLVDKEYARSLARRIDIRSATKVKSHSTPPDSSSDFFGKHTTHFSAADAVGNWVACTATINTTYGSKVVVPGTGVVLNNEMDDFSAEPGKPNAFGLVGGEANAVAPGKRPLSSMSPTILLRGGKPVLSVGAAGGPTIISQTLLAIIQLVDFGEPVPRALAQPRFHQQWIPDELRIEESVPLAVRDELSRRGHTLKVMDSIGACQAVGMRAGTQSLEGAADPRIADGEAGGF
jgi:gamma-glutamyltranspeptidase/glutathione hydrolase